MHCQVCGKRTKVRQTTSFGQDQLKRLRVCTDDSCEALPFWTYEKRAKNKKVKMEGENNEKSSCQS